MEPDELETLQKELTDAAAALEEALQNSISELIGMSLEVVKAWKNIQAAFTKGDSSAHIVIEPLKLSFIIYPLGTGEPHFMIRTKRVCFTEQDKESFKELGIKLDPDKSGAGEPFHDEENRH